MRVVFKSLFTFIVALLFFLSFPSSMFAYDGTITVSNVTYDYTTKALSFNKDATYNWFANFGTVTLHSQTQEGTVGYGSYTDIGYNCGYNNAPCDVTLSHGFNVPYNSSDIFYITFTDGNHSYISNIFTLVNMIPEVSQLNSGIINVGETYSTNGSFIDVDSTSWIGTVDYGDGTGVQPLILNKTDFSLNHQYTQTGIYLITVSITDDQGNTGTASINITVAPSTIINLSLNSRGTYSDPTTVTLTATAASGFSIANTYYTIDGGSQQIYNNPFIVRGEGSHTITYWSVDSAGNQELTNIKTFIIIYDGFIEVDDITYNNATKELSFYKDATYNFFVDLGTIRLHSQTQDMGLVGYASYTDNGYNCTYNSGPCNVILKHGFEIPYNPLDTFYITFNDGNYSYKSNTFILAPPSPVIVTFNASADSHVRSGQANRNYGALDFMRIHSSGDNRGLVRFNQSELQSVIGSGAAVLSAKLRLTITDNGNNWGSTGRSVDVHRLIANWMEGNGTETDRGTGDGATWNCAIDSIISNQAKNCSGSTEWEMGQPNNPAVHPWIQTATDTEIITNNQIGVIEYDVTSDVANFINGTSNNYGWLIKKTNESQNGHVSFGTRETSFAPQLVVTYQP